MKKVLLGCLLAATAVSAAGTLSNVGYLAAGYDIFRGNPKSTLNPGVDPGFKGSLFQFRYSQNLVTDDGRWSIPDNTVFRINKGCLLDFVSKEVTSATSYASSLEEAVEVSLSFAGNKFSASSDFKSVESRTSSYHSVFVQTSASCSVYDGFLSIYDLAELHPNFVQGIRSLPTEYSEEAYMKFLSAFGTHFVQEVTMGARFGFLSELSESSYKTAKQKNLKLDIAASAAAWGVTGSAHSLTNEEKQESADFKSLVSRISKFSLGTNPPADGKTESWSSTAIDEPMPIRYRLESIAELFYNTTRDTLEDPSVLQDKDLEALRPLVERALDGYCSYLKKRNLVSSCDPIPDPSPAPIQENTCRVCAKSCGGEFPVDNGAVSVTKSWPEWSFSYAEQCPDNSYGHYGTDNRGLRICCQPKAPEESVGECRICQKCAGDWSYFGGKIMSDQNWKGFMSSFDYGCAGEQRARDNTFGGMSLCCRDKPVCSLCQSCGGEWPSETGVFGADQNWPGFFSSRGRLCAGEPSQPDDAKEGIKFCCKSPSAVV